MKVSLNRDDVKQYSIRLREAFSNLVMKEKVATFVKTM